MTPELQKLLDEATETVGAADSAVVLVNGLGQYIRDNANDPAALLAKADELDQAQARIKAAVDANPVPGSTPTP